VGCRRLSARPAHATEMRDRNPQNPNSKMNHAVIAARVA
jgi:hypothetical protein